MTKAPSSMPRLSPVATRVASSGLLKATSRMKPKYAAIIAIVSEMATRHRAAETASRVEWEGIETPSSQRPTPKPVFGTGTLDAGSWQLGDSYFFSTSSLLLLGGLAVIDRNH